MNESLLSSSGDSLDLSTTENINETFASYSILFDKNKQNFSTSSEISFIKHNLSPIDHNETVTKEIINNISIKESTNFNPFLLLFTKDDEEQQVKVSTNRKITFFFFYMNI